MKKIILMAVATIMAVAVSTAAPKQEKQIVTTVFVTDIDCEGCAKKITNTIPYERGIKNLKVDVATQSVTVTYDASKNSVEQLTKAFESIKVKVFKALNEQEFEHHKQHATHSHVGHNHSHAGHSHAH
jgi:copper chaperone CopZ